MKVWTYVRSLLGSAVAALAKKEGIDLSDLQVQVEQPKFENQGDFASPVALGLARTLHRSPMSIANDIVDLIGEMPGDIEKVVVAPPGYINIFVKHQTWFEMLQPLLKDPGEFIKSDIGANKKVLIEFVSANPTGPLHVGHARGAILGDTLAGVMSAAGYDVKKEYYLNDRGNQISALAESVYARGREVLGLDAAMPENGYKGTYIIDIAKKILKTPDGEVFKKPFADLGDADSNVLALTASGLLREEIKKGLKGLGIEFDSWFSERSLFAENRVDTALDILKDKGFLYELEDNALLFKSTQFGDDQDRVVIRSNGLSTYFASDIAYHDEKFSRGFDTLINIWGADHHGYIPRMRAAMRALGYNPDDMETLLVQMVSLMQNGRPVPMGKRSGDYYTLSDLVNEVGRDAVRFIFLTRKADAQMEFDIEVARSNSMDNPVYYVQYGYARLRSILAKANLSIDDIIFDPALAAELQYPEERQLVKKAAMFPFTVEQAAISRQPHLIAFTLMDLVKSFHSYYTQYKNDKILSEDPKKRAARIVMAAALARVIHAGLDLVGVNAPEVMNRED